MQSLAVVDQAVGEFLPVLAIASVVILFLLTASCCYFLIIPTVQRGVQQSETALSDYGLTVAPAEDGAGVVVTEVDPDSPAADAGGLGAAARP